MSRPKWKTSTVWQPLNVSIACALRSRRCRQGEDPGLRAAQRAGRREPILELTPAPARAVRRGDFRGWGADAAGLILRVYEHLVHHPQNAK